MGRTTLKVINYHIFRIMILNNKSDMREILQKLKLIGRKPKKNAYKHKRKKLNKLKELKKKEEKPKQKKFE
jgi:hypothetical protein